MGSHAPCRQEIFCTYHMGRNLWNMPTLISVQHPNGGKRGRTCDENCYGAKKVSAGKCRCVCGGANHGVGLPQARENTLALQGDAKWRESYKGRTISLNEAQLMLSLWLDDLHKSPVC